MPRVSDRPVYAIDARAAARPELRRRRALGARAARAAARAAPRGLRGAAAAAGARAPGRARVGAGRAAAARGPTWRAGAAVPGQPRAGRLPARGGRAPRRGGAAPSGLVLARLRRLAAAAATAGSPARPPRHHRLGVLPARAGRAPGSCARARDRRARRRRRRAFRPDADAGRPCAALGLTRPYVLCVASHIARKDLAALVPAARALARDGVEVVVAGGHRPQFAAEQGLGPLRLLGHVPDPLLPGLYAGAEAFALPSHYGSTTSRAPRAASPTALPRGRSGRCFRSTRTRSSRSTCAATTR